MINLLNWIRDKFFPISEEDRKLIAHIKSKKTLRAVNGALYIGAEDVAEGMKKLHAATRHLVQQTPPDRPNDP